MEENTVLTPLARNLTEPIRLSLRLAEHPDLKAFIGPRLDPRDLNLASDAALDEWLLSQVTIYSHISGTCKMGPSPDTRAVVDQYGKVHGLEGLRVVDASIMPTLVRAPINPTVLMMGEQMADFICQGK